MLYVNVYFRKAGTSKILMGFADGRIRITNLKTDNMLDLSDYIEYSIHDNKTGSVKMLCLSKDSRMLFTCGNDGNIFSFVLQCDNDIIEKCTIQNYKLPQSFKISVGLNNICQLNLKIKTILNLLGNGYNKNKRRSKIEFGREKGQ